MTFKPSQMRFVKHFVHHLTKYQLTCYELSPNPSVGPCLCVCLSVGQSVCLSGKCTVAKRLNGSGCCLGWWVGSVEGWVYYMGWLSSKGRGSVGVNLGRPLVTNGGTISAEAWICIFATA